MALDYMFEVVKKYEYYRRNWRKYVEVIKEIASKYFGENLASIYVFGSFIRGDYKPLSDIDVAIVLFREVDEWSRARFRLLVKREIGLINPFEIHIITADLWKNWFLRFVKKDYIEI
ncbi:MAG: hypothetical protein B6U89_05700 [Desulfurococcales archaeon ex4484_58]|nr:MAG: hypothetical protein B6U89_05700 [Desulfurococcales archaeon ex4484_58]